MLTNYPYPQYRKKCMNGGADYFFDKSTEFNKITEVLKPLMNITAVTPTTARAISVSMRVNPDVLRLIDFSVPTSIFVFILMIHSP